MRMAALDQIVGCATCKIDDLRDFEIAEDAVVEIAAFLAEEAEEQEHVPRPHAPVRQMRLRRTALAEQAGAIGKEHRVVVAQRARIDPPPAGTCGMFAQPEIAIGGARGGACGDRQADRPTLHDRRRAATRSAVEPLAREDNSHANPVP